MEEKKLLKYAVEYLSKYDSSKNNLSNVLKRKIYRSEISSIEKKKVYNIVEKIIINLEKNNLIDDKKYCLSKISYLSRIGKSKSFIYNYLLKKGVGKFEINDNFEEFKQSNNDWEINSAKLFAKKKKLLESNDTYEKKLAKMARAGFSYDICKKILG